MGGERRGRDRAGAQRRPNESAGLGGMDVFQPRGVAVTDDGQPADCGGTPLTFALAVFISIVKVAATSAGPKAEPSLNFTFFRIVTAKSFPPFWKL